MILQQQQGWFGFQPFLDVKNIRGHEETSKVTGNMRRRLTRSLYHTLLKTLKEPSYVKTQDEERWKSPEGDSVKTEECEFQKR